MQSAKPCEFGVLQTRDGAEQADLLGVFKLGLEPDHIPDRAQLVVLPQLHHCVGPATARVLGRCPVRVVEPDWLHRAIAQGIDPARCHHFNRHAAFEVGSVGFPLAELGLFAIEQALMKSEILLFGHRAVDVILAALVPACSHPGDVHIDRIAVDDRRDGIEERQTVRAGRGSDTGSECGGREGTGRDDRQASRWQSVNPFADHGERWQLCKPLFNLGREHIAVHRQRRPGGNLGHLCGGHDQRIEPAHFMVQQADSVAFMIVGAK